MQALIQLRHPDPVGKFDNRLIYLCITVAVLLQKDGRPLTAGSYADRVAELRELTSTSARGRARENQINTARAKGQRFAGQLSEKLKTSNGAFTPRSTSADNVKVGMVELFGNSLHSVSATSDKIKGPDYYPKDIWASVKTSFREHLKGAPGTSLLLVELPAFEFLNRTLDLDNAANFIVGPRKFSLVGIFYWNKGSLSIASGVINTSEDGGSEWWRYDDVPKAESVERTSGGKLALSGVAAKVVFMMLFRSIA